MKAIQIQTYGGSQVVHVTTDATEPVLSAGKILVEIYAAGVNPADWKIREGYFAPHAPLTFPATLGGDFSGVVLGMGEGVMGFKKGDCVYGTALALGSGSGSFAERAWADIQTIARKPSTISHNEAAALPLAGVSAYQALVEHMYLAKGQRILIHGGAGGIGSFAIQIARHIGAQVITTASADDSAYVRDLGADEVIDYKVEKFYEKLSDLDAVFDTVGGETYTRSFPILKKGGILVSMLEKPDKELMARYGVTAIGQFTQVTNSRLSALTRLVDAGALRVHLAKVFPLDEARDALEYLRAAHPRGKVVVEVRSRT